MASTVTAANSHGRALHTRTTSSRALTGWGRRTLAMAAHHANSPRARVVVRASAQRATWLPGLDPPAHLDGTLPGDYGFDPLGLGEEPAALKWYVQAELVHCRFAMAGVAGILFTDLLRVSGIKDLPVWFEAGAAKYDFANTTALFFVQLLLMGFTSRGRNIHRARGCACRFTARGGWQW
nr:unnamed protein product [Digitaria exilis]